MIEQKQVKPANNVEEILRFIGYKQVEVEKVRDEPLLKEFTQKLQDQGYSLGLLNDFATRLRGKGYSPNFIGGAVTALLSRKIAEPEKKYSLEREIKLLEKLPGAIAKAVAQELERISICTTAQFWGNVITIDLSSERASAQLLGRYAGGDCVYVLPDSTGNATIRLDSATSYGYRMRSVYRKVRAPFDSIYIENTAQPGLFLHLGIARGDITTEAWT